MGQGYKTTGHYTENSAAEKKDQYCDILFIKTKSGHNFSIDIY